MTDANLIELQNIYVKKGNITLLQDISLTIQVSKIITIIGPNGAGKTTLARLLLGLLKPTNGKILRQDKLNIGYVPQKVLINELIPITVERFLKLAPSQCLTVQEVLDWLKIIHIKDRHLKALSGGEWQRVLLARALLSKPQLLVLDEPVQGVDIVGQSELYELISQIKNEFNCSIFIVSHDLHLVMASTDIVFCLNKHICCWGNPQDVSKHPEFLQLFGGELANKIAVYSHNHNHQHNLRGEIID